MPIDNANRRWWIWFAGTTVAWFVCFYILSCLSLLISLSGESGDFSSAAREYYSGYITWIHFKLIIGYLLVAVFLVLLFFPIARLWQIRKPCTRRRTILRATLIVFLMTFMVGSRILQQPYLASGWFGSIYHGLSRVTPGVIKWFFSPSVIGGIVLFMVSVSAVLYGHIIFQKIRSRRLRSSIAAASAILVLLAGVLITARSSAAPAEPEPEKPWNILILSCDSLRGDHLSCNGYEREEKTTPNIDLFAEDSVNFTRAMTPIADTLSSWMTLLTSQYPKEHGIRYIYPQPEVLGVAEKGRTFLPALLREKGYKTIAMGDWCASCFKWLDMGFEEINVSDVQTFKVVLGEYIYKHHLVIMMYFDNVLGQQMFPELKNFSCLMTAEKVTDRVVSRLKKLRYSDQPFFMTVFYSCAHLPYKSNEPYASKYKNPDYKGPNEYEVRLKINDIIEQNYPGSTDPKELQQIRDIYDRAVSEFDGNIGRIIDKIRELGLMEKTIVIVTADHGEDLYDPGTTLGHGINFNGGDQSNHVPLIIRMPESIFPPGKVDRLVRLIDLAPTLTDVLDIERPEDFRGRSLLPYLLDTEDDIGLLFYGEEGFAFGSKKPAYDILWDMPSITELFELDNTFDSNMVVKRKYHDRLIKSRERCISTDRWKVVRRVLKSGPSYSLFDKWNDPFCLCDVSADRPDVFVPMVKWLEEWMETNADHSGKPRPFSDE